MTRYKYTRKQLSQAYGGYENDSDFIKDLLAKEPEKRFKYSEVPPLHLNTKEVPIKRKHQEAPSNGPPYCKNCGKWLTISERERECHAPEECKVEKAQKRWDKKYGKNSIKLMGYVECHCKKCEAKYHPAEKPKIEKIDDSNLRGLYDGSLTDRLWQKQCEIIDFINSHDRA